MNGDNLGYSGDLLPKEAWSKLEKEKNSFLVDCRTDAEWSFVGVPDISKLQKEPFFIPWQVYPHMHQNEGFAAQLSKLGAKKDDSVLFICRSGGRSRMAAIAMMAQGFHHCYNVAYGFEGDRDENGHRSMSNGWKHDKLPWYQK